MLMIPCSAWCWVASREQRVSWVHVLPHHAAQQVVVVLVQHEAVHFLMVTCVGMAA